MSGDELGAEAHLYLATPADWLDGAPRETTLELLSSAERRRYESFRATAAARAFATGRALARRVLSLYAAIAPDEWRLEPDEHGRPRIEEPGAGDLDFNLSHNDRLVACVVTGGASCGVDIESLDRPVDALRIAGHSFGEQERADLERLAGEARRRLFFSLWTLKEAFLKACGQGIAMRLDSALFRLGGEIEVHFAPRIGEREGDWQFALFRAADRQLVALAVRRGAGADLGIRTFRARPGRPRGATRNLQPLAASRPPATASR